MTQARTFRDRIRTWDAQVGKVIDRIESACLMFCVAALALLLIINVIAREFFQSIYFVEEVTEFLVIIITFVGISYAVRKARHIRMGAFLDVMPPKLEKVFTIGISAVSACVMFVMAHAAYEYFMFSWQSGHETGALRLPYATFYAIMPLGFSLAGLQYLRTIVRNLVEEEAWLSADQQSEYD